MAPYADQNLFLFDGNGDQVVYISRATQMVALRVGDAPPRSPEWDNSIIPNVLIGAIIRRPDDASIPLPDTY